jgi:hypothetical protein
MRRIPWGLSLLFVAVSAISIAGQESENEDGVDATRVRIGLNIAPVPLDLRGKDRTLVGLGSYIINAQGSRRISPRMHTAIRPA